MEDQPAAEPTPYGVVATPRALAELRLVAERAVRGHDDPAVLALVDRLRAEDPQLWPHLHAPACALAARRLGDERAWPLLDEAVGLGFTQPELFEGELEDAFAGDEPWPAARERMRLGTLPALALVTWPDPAPQLPVRLDRLAPDREAELLALIPADVRRGPGQAGAWETALATLTWVRRSWEHANDHVEDPDAVDVLDRVAAGERFACVEYSIVLSQALNALGLAARRVQLFQQPHHVGVGRGHVVSEVWVDDLPGGAGWVLLDGQNGAYWTDGSGRPLGLPELVGRRRDGEPSRLVGHVVDLDPGAAARWATYFTTVATTGVGVAEGDFVASFQGVSVPRAGRLTRSSDLSHPDLDAVWVGVAGDLSQPLLTLGSLHPSATGFVITGDGWVDEIDAVGAGSDGWPVRLDLPAGEHRARVAVRTPYGVGRGHDLVWRIA